MGKSSGKAKTPSIAADNLESKQILSIIDIIGEGKIKGPVNGLKSIFLDGTPIQNEDGSFNFSGVEVEWTAGTQAQEPLKGFTEAQNEVSVGLEVKRTTPLVRTISDPYIDRVRVTVGVKALLSQSTGGDVSRTSVSMEIQIGKGGTWTTKKKFELIDKKTRSGYLRSIILDDLPEAPFNIRVVRITEDSTSDLLSNTTVWSSYTEIYDTKLSYPNTALVGLRFDSSQFNGIPTRTYLIDGIECRVPDNYDPETRSYNGLWTGNFKTEWTNNPAWIVYDILLHNRYGMGKRFGRFSADRFMMYSISQRCDELVDDGFGGKEPRFTCNSNITEQSQAYDLINKFFSIFRAMPIWDGMQMTAVVDKPSDPVAIYTNANVVGGKFSYSSSAMKDRHTAARVKYVDPDYGWEAISEYVPDDDLIERFGFNVYDVEAFGCTSRGQAHRFGNWLIQTEKLETKTTSFSVGLEGLRHQPGDIIGILDNNYVGMQAGGRIKSINGKTITLDRDVEIGENAYITYQDVDAKQVKVKVISQDAPNVLTLKDKVNADEWTIWILTNSIIALRLCRALSITENDDGTYGISVLDHDPNKELIVDSSASFDTAATPLTTYGQSAPKNIKITPFYAVNQGLTVTTLTAEWDKAEGAAHYEAQWRKDNGTWVNVPQTPNVAIEIEGIYSGIYDVRVRSINAVGTSSPWGYSDSTSIAGKVGKPDKPIAFSATDDVVLGIDLSWSFPVGSGDTSHTEIEYSTNESEENALLLSNVTYPSCSYSQTGLAIGQVFYYRARLVDKIGNTGDWTDWVRGVSSTNTNDLSNHIFDEIKDTDAWNSLTSQTDENTNSITQHATELAENAKVAAQNALSSIENSKSIIQNALANDKDVQVWRKEVGNVNAEIKETKALIVTENEATAIKLTELSSNMDGANANIDELKQTTVIQGEKLSSQSDVITSLNSGLDNVEKGVGANSTAIDSLNTKVEKQGDNIESISGSLSQLGANIDSVNANSSVTSSTQALAIIKNALNTDDESLKRRENDGQNLQEIQVVAETVTKLSAGLDGAKGEIVDLKQVVVKQGESIESQSTSLTQLSSSIDNVDSKADNAQNAADTANSKASANANAINSMNTKVTEQGNKITTQATAISSIGTSLGNVTAKITDVSKAVQSTDDKLSAYRTMKVAVDNKGQQYVAGMTLGVEQTATGVQSNVIFLADNFMVMNQVNGTPVPAFMTKDGVAIMNYAIIGDGTITNAKIGNVIQSENFKEDANGVVSGWQLSKNPGKFKGVDVDLSGRIKATSGEMDNVVINKTCTISKLKVDQIEGDVLKTVYVDVNSTITIPAVDFDRSVISAPLILSVYGATATCELFIDGKSAIYLYAKGVSHTTGGQGATSTTTRWSVVKQGMLNYSLLRGQSLTVKYTCTTAEPSDSCSFPSTLFLLLTKI